MKNLKEDYLTKAGRQEKEIQGLGVGSSQDPRDKIIAFPALLWKMPRDYEGGAWEGRVWRRCDVTSK